MTANILKRHDAYTFEYPQAIEFAEAQEDILWTANEIVLEKDLHDLKNTLTEAEYHGVVTGLRLFTEYERIVGGDYWTGRMMRIFKRPEFQRLFSLLGSVELNIHAPFYDKINAILGLNTEEFYLSYVQDPVLKARVDAIHEVVGLKITDEKDILKSVGAFSIVEGAILYSNFAFFKHFRAEGKNKLANLVGGIDFSVRDEHLHSLVGAWVFRTLLQEMGLTDQEVHDIDAFLIGFSEQVMEHEGLISEMMFEKGPIVGITKHQLDNFVQSRVCLCLDNLGISAFEKPSYNPIAGWFYKSIQSPKMHDFFNNQGSEYRRAWREARFGWRVANG